MMDLLQMPGGQPHSSVSAPMIDVPYYRLEGLVTSDINVQVTCSRLALTLLIFTRPDALVAPRFIV